MTTSIDDMSEKLIKQLPPIRVDEPMFSELAERAAQSDRKLSDYIRHALKLYLALHAEMVNHEASDGE
jgi:hypothetical protein